MTSPNPDTRSDRRSDIIEATLSLAFEVGPNAVSTSLIAKRLRVSQPAIYKHFKTKDAIWLDISEQLSERIRENALICVASQLSPERRLRDLVVRHLTFIQDVPAMPDIMVMRQASDTHQVVRQRLQHEMGQLRDLMVGLTGQAQQSGVVRADLAADDIITLLVGVMQGQILRMILSRDPSRLLADGARLFDLQIETLAPRGPTP